ncbi:MAG: hypothetical protein ACLFNL_10030 [Bacteroidales bacterium]
MDNFNLTNVSVTINGKISRLRQLFNFWKKREEEKLAKDIENDIKDFEKAKKILEDNWSKYNTGV